MITRVSTINELKQLFTEILINKSGGKVTKISDESVLNGVAYGVAKIAQKALKDVALVESHLFPDYAYGQHLDDIANKQGVGGRLGPSKSSTYIRLVGDPGTVYDKNTHTFIGNGKTFELSSNVTIGSEGYVYAHVQSTALGKITNVPALTINTVTPVPTGHAFVTNEYEARGGRDVEDDTSFRIRIKQNSNIVAKDTLNYILQVFLKFNSDILRVHCHGVNDQNQAILSITTQNATLLSDDELKDLLYQSKKYLSLLDYNSLTDTSINVVLQNIEFQPQDISFRCELIQNSLADQTRKEIQIEMSKYLDFRFWKSGQKIEWDNLLQIVKDHPNVKYVVDSFFYPNNDVEVDITKLPRIRGFVMLDLDGNLIIDNSNVLNPIFYPNEIDFKFQSTIN